MPITIPSKMPAYSVLQSEKIFVISEDAAVAQDIRPLYILILNLMPIKISTELHLLRQLANNPLQVIPHFIYPKYHKSKNTATEHLENFYHNFDELEQKKFDGLIITGAPLESLDFSDVSYWRELQEILDWSRTHVTSTLYICWGALAGLYHFYNIEKTVNTKKLSGIFSHELLEPYSQIARGFDDIFMAPHSRYASIDLAQIKNADLDIISTSAEAGLYIALGNNGREVFVLGHPEYDSYTLKEEYFRDLNKNKSPIIPKNYFPNDDPNLVPPVTWRSHASLLYNNWLNYYVYQETPYIL